MKNYKILLISFVLLIFMIGAVSASDVDSSDASVAISEDNPLDINQNEPAIAVSNDENPIGANTKDIYVNDTGDDSNVGSSVSPYATIKKAIGDVNSSEETTIHLSEGIFASDDDSNLQINFNHVVDGGSLTIVGAGPDKTFVDGQAAFRFAQFGYNTNVTLKDISFIYFKQWNGAAIYLGNSILTIENCIFKDIYANSYQGAISAGGNNAVLTVKDTQFISCSVNGNSWQAGGAAIYAQNIASLNLINNMFIENTIASGNGVAVYTTSSKSYVDGNKFINLTGTNDASIYLNSQDSTLCNNEFINCTNPSDTYAIVNIAGGSCTLKNNIFTNSTNSLGEHIYATGTVSGLNITMSDEVISVGNAEVNKGVDVSVNVTDDMGNIVKTTAYAINFVNDKDSYTFNPTILNGKTHIDFLSVPNVGIYNVTVTSQGNTTGVLTTADIHCSSEPVDLYVAPDGDDGNNGTVDSPFATIQHALDTGFNQTFNVVVHLLEGTYSGEGNVALTIFNKGTVQIIGEKYNETIIDGNDENRFIYSEIETTIKNIKFINGYIESYDGLINGGYEQGKISLEDCIMDSNYAENGYIFYNVNMNNVIFTNNIGLSELYQDCIINNSYFANNNNPFGAIINPVVATSNVIENCRFVNNTADEGVLVGSSFTCKNNYFEGNSAKYGGAIYTYKHADLTLENNTFVNNKAEIGGVLYVGGESYDQQTPSLIFNDCKFINNSAVKAGVANLIVATFNDCSFINNTADYGGVFVLSPLYIEADYDYENDKWVIDDDMVPSLELNNVIFENNVAKVNGNDIYLDQKEYEYAEDECSRYVIPLTITFNNANVSSLVDDLTAEVYGPANATIGSFYEMIFELDGTKIGTGGIVNSAAAFTYDGFEDGKYVLSGNTYFASSKNVINNATVNVKLENISDSIEYWISPQGSDENGNGSESNPFNSISYAVSVASKNSRNITIHISEGNYTGKLNTNLSLSSANNLALVGAGMDKTIIDGETSNYFAAITDGKNKVTISDLTITNMLPMNVENVLNIQSGYYNQISDKQNYLNSFVSPITVLEGGSLCLNNVNVSNNRGGKSIIENNGNLVVNNSIFDKNGLVAISLISGYNTYIDNTVFTSNFAINNILSSDLLVINNSAFINNFNLYGYSFSNGGSSYWTAVDVLTIVENTEFYNDGDNSSLKLIGYDEIFNGLAPAFALNRNTTANNISMVNDFKSPCLEYAVNLYRDGAKLAPIGWIWGDGGKFVNVYNSTFKNFKYIWSNTASRDSAYNFDGCVFDNITMIAVCGASRGYMGEPHTTYNVSNSVFLNTGLEIDRNSAYSLVPNITLDNNYWGSNDKPVITYLKVDGTVEPATWIALYSEDEKSVIKNVTDGENSTEYTGIAPIRTDYADNKGALDYAVVFGPIGYLFTTDNETNVIFDPEDEIFPFVAADPMDYRTPTNIAIIGFEGDKNVIAMLVDIVGNPIANATITSTFTGMDAVNTTTDENGTFTVKAGKDGILCIVFAGDDTYFDDEYDLKFVNAGKTAKTFINFIEVDGELVITGTLTDDEGTPITSALVSYVVNGNTTGNATTDANGTFKVQGESNAVIDVAFAGNDIFDAVNATITLKDLAATRMATEIKADDFTQYAIDVKAGEKGGYFKAQLVDASGNPMVNKTVQIGFNGVVYTKITNESGWVQLQINLAKAGEYTFAVVFLGDGDYNASFVVKKITVNKKKTSIDASAKSFKSSVKTKKYTVTLKTDKGSSVDGKTYLRSGKKITLTVGGTTYTAKTNANGQATFKITKLSKKGKFTATVKFDGDDGYLASSKTAKITIK